MDNTRKVFGIGLSRTGTKSLTVALNTLGWHIAHYPTDEQTLQDLRSTNANFRILRQINGITDLTVVPFYSQLDQLFPNSQFILTVRHREQWLRSLRQHWDYAEQQYQLADNPADWIPVLEATRLLKMSVFGRHDFHSGHMLATYEKHCTDVLEYFQQQPHKLLVLDICAGEGWEKLCPFLGCDMLEHPFPYVEFRQPVTLRCEESVA